MSKISKQIKDFIAQSVSYAGIPVRVSDTLPEGVAILTGAADAGQVVYSGDLKAFLTNGKNANQTVLLTSPDGVNWTPMTGKIPDAVSVDQTITKVPEPLPEDEINLDRELGDNRARR